MEDAFKLYSLGQPLMRIAKDLGISRTTIYKWRNQGDWDSRANQIKANARDKVDETVAQMKAKHFKINEAILGKFIKDVKADKVHPTPSDANQAMRLQMHIKGESESTTTIETRDIFTDLREDLAVLQKKKKKK